MEILFLGTSSGWPLPRLGCGCEICSSDDPKDKRSRPALLVNRTVLLDAPIDIYGQLQKNSIDPRKLTHIAITHAHDDHVFGLYDLSHIYNRVTADYRLKEKITLIAPQGVLNAMRKLVGVSMQAFRIREARPFEKIEIGNDSYVSFIPVEHGAVEAYGIKIKAPKPIFYAPEFRRILPSSKKEIGDVELAVIDGSSKTGYGQAKGHETIEEGIRLGKEIHAKKILFTNIGHKTDTHEKLVNFVKETGGNKSVTAGYRFGIAFDGLEVKV
ncbi:MBL fold metallo-hydrolase [Candidatus Woesebacteria bacterium]|nr:MBL fold metallo-hydrolase [Candidatus Woesebacteria bacterium]